MADGNKFLHNFHPFMSLAIILNFHFCWLLPEESLNKLAHLFYFYSLFILNFILTFSLLNFVNNMVVELTKKKKPKGYHVTHWINSSALWSFFYRRWKKLIKAFYFDITVWKICDGVQKDKWIEKLKCYMKFKCSWK